MFRLLTEEEGRPTREISSVMMTTSGYISPAREGKLPESRTPLASLETVTAINSVSVPSNQVIKSNKLVKKVEKKKDKMNKDLSKPLLEERSKKLSNSKDIQKLKHMKPTSNSSLNSSVTNFPSNDIKVPVAGIKMPCQNNKVNKALAAARLKTEKLNTTITPIPMRSSIVPQLTNDNVDKLISEPDKKKVNIFKKISNVKNDKFDNRIGKLRDDNKQESRENSPVLVIDETLEQNVNKLHISNNVTIELVDPKQHINKSQEKYDKSICYDDSPPGTPLTPKTPEMISHSPPVIKEKRKRKDKSKVKKVQKVINSYGIDSDIMEIDMLRPKTPEAQIEKPDHFPPITSLFQFGFSPFGK